MNSSEQVAFISYLKYPVVSAEHSSMPLVERIDLGGCTHI